ncbi:hypothetical protein [Stutzerimonas frequens]|uniref:hypothetical protein n=1 Tax=Stutzerimonas frequens TaxID=2968969 RepID=UPI0007B92A33|nr:hypothetical protein [Stutzerimonas frequens]MCD1640420.1 hypothetical protein [Stutzerimonas stutzeri]KZX65112.1 hypothetical protein A3710_00040 [Stutzerimonas frequens]MBK3873473.1 hypothetical protein [Stutzerimonas frequens]MBK3911742.1 hypothetical protein [Stutzerimonas frequens]MBK3931025.1 hypothetical protein [Stutzerimonas frequens]
MRSTEVEDRRHSTGEQDPMPRLRRRFFGSLVLIGLLIGLMIGRLTAPGPVQLELVQVQPQGLSLQFDREPEVYDEHLEGAFALLFQAEGEAQAGQLQIDGMPVAWRVQQTEKGLLLHLVAARRLQGQWQGAHGDGGWQVQVSVSPWRP